MKKLLKVIKIIILSYLGICAFVFIISFSIGLSTSSHISSSDDHDPVWIFDASKYWYKAKMTPEPWGKPEWCKDK